MRRKIVRTSLLAGALAFCGIPVFLVEGALKAPKLRRVNPPTPPEAEVTVTGEGGIRLNGALLRSANPNGKAVLLLHGVGDSRRAVLEFAPFLNANGFLVLAADSRGHGVSEGDLVSYGIAERADVSRWADFLLSQPGVTRLYGLGESMGAAVLIQSMASERRFAAIVAEGSYSTFREAATERIPRFTGLPRWFGRPIIETGFLYARIRYGIDLEEASPEKAIRGATTPVLLIHGLADTRTAPYQSRRLHEANRKYTELWEVPGAGHTRAWRTEPAEFQRRVLAWFAR